MLVSGPEDNLTMKVHLKSGSLLESLDHTDEINLTENVFAFARFRPLFPLFLVLFFDQSERLRTWF